MGSAYPGTRTVRLSLYSNERTVVSKRGYSCSSIFERGLDLAAFSFLLCRRFGRRSSAEHPTCTREAAGWTHPSFAPGNRNSG